MEGGRDLQQDSPFVPASAQLLLTVLARADMY